MAKLIETLGLEDLARKGYEVRKEVGNIMVLYPYYTRVEDSYSKEQGFLMRRIERIYSFCRIKESPNLIVSDIALFERERRINRCSFVR